MKKRLFCAVFAIFACCIATMVMAPKMAFAGAECETAILPDEWCGDDGIFYVLRFVINVLTGGVIVLGTMGYMIAGAMYLLARDNKSQVEKAKTRIIEITIGVIAFVLIDFLLVMFVGKNLDQINNSLPQAMVVPAETTEVA